MKVEFPSVIVKTGSGKFYNSVNNYESDFEIFNYPDRNLIITKPQSNLDIVHLFSSTEQWKLEGYLNDGTPVTCESLFINEFTGDFFQFFVAKELFFGNKELNIEYAIFPLIGFYEGKIKLTHENWKIETDEEIYYKTKKQQRISKIWKTQLEARTLRLQFNKDLKINDYIQKISNISSLLSLATGNEIAFHRQLYYSSDNETLEVWRKRIAYHFGIDSIIDPISLTSLLEQTLTKFEKLDREKRGAINRAVDYINSAAHGYLEDRIFRVSLAWELLSFEYFPFSNLDPELKDLKKRLKSAIKEWNKDYPLLNKYGFLNDRITKSLTWEKLISQMKKFAESEKLNLEKIGVDFYEIKEIRDNVAHTGKFGKKYDSAHLIDIIEKAILGLRILILRKLCYSGDIQKPSKRFLVRTSIFEFLKIAPPNT